MPVRRFTIPFAIVVLLTIAAVLAGSRPVSAFRQTNLDFEVVDRESLRVAMDAASKSGYEPTATTNGIRYQVDVLSYLLKNNIQPDQRQSGEARPLLIRYDDWYEVFKTVNTKNEGVPRYIELAKEYQQSIIIDHDREAVIKEVKRGGTPDLAANVALCWPPGRRNSFSYRDTLSTPELEVTNERVITYRLLKYDDLTILDQIKGLKGQALSGFLRFLGKANMTKYRTLPGKDESQYVRIETRKWKILSRSTDLTINPEGVTMEGVPSGEKRHLLRTIEIEYNPLRDDSFTCSF